MTASEGVPLGSATVSKPCGGGVYQKRERSQRRPPPPDTSEGALLTPALLLAPSIFPAGGVQVVTRRLGRKTFLDV
jgi:hypothetical protein